MPVDLYLPPKPAIVRIAEPWEKEVNRDLIAKGVPLHVRQDVVSALRKVFGGRSDIARAQVSDLEEYVKRSVNPMLALGGSFASFLTASGNLAAAPTVVGTPATFFNNSAANTHSFNLPSGIQSGELICLFCGAQANVGGTWSEPSGWSLLFNWLNGNSSGALAWLVRDATGSEGSTVDVTKGGTTTRAAGVAFRVSGAKVVNATDMSNWQVTGSSDAGASANPDPNVLQTNYGGAPDASGENLLWLAVMNSQHNNTPSAFPSNYTEVATGSGTTATGSTVSVAQRTKTPSVSENPGTFTTPNSSRWATLTCYLRPA